MKNHAKSCDEKNKRVFRNIASYLLYDFVIVVFGFILPRMFLVHFGSEFNGLDSTVRQIFSWMSLLEAGVGLASQQALYNPVAKNDRDSINSILSATKHYYLKSGLIYLIIMLFFAGIYPLCIKSEQSFVIISGVIIFYGIPGVLSFLFQGKYRTFLEVEGKTYILTNLTTICLIIANMSRLLLMMHTDNILLIQATYCIPSVIQIIFVVWYIRRKYPWIDFSVAPDLSALRQKNAVLVHQISSVVFHNTDTVMISILCGFKDASIYAVYSLFFSNFEKLIYAFTGSLNFRLGQMFCTDKERFTRVFDLYELAYIMGSFIFYTIIAAFILPVIMLYTRGVNDGNYESVLLVALFALVNMLTSVKTPHTQIINFHGSFNRTQKHAVIEMVLNLSVSVIATIHFGIAGCLLGTVIALTYRCIVAVYYANRAVLKKSCLVTYRRFFVNLLIAVAVLLHLGFYSCEPRGYLYVCLHAFLNAIWILAVFLLVNLIFEYPHLLAARDFFKKKNDREKSEIFGFKTYQEEISDLRDSDELRRRCPGIARSELLLKRLNNAGEEVTSSRERELLEDSLCREYIDLVCKDRLLYLDGFVPAGKELLRKSHTAGTVFLALVFTLCPRGFCNIKHLFNIAVVSGELSFKSSIVILAKALMQLGCYLIPVQRNKIVFDNFLGRGFGDDAKYIAQDLLKSGKKLSMYWIVSEPDAELPAGIKPILKSNRFLVMYHLASAGVWVDNVKNFTKPPKKRCQLYIQTWHSLLGLKKNESDAKTLNACYVLTAKRDASQTDLMYSDNNIRKEQYENTYWYSGPVLKCDVPRMQILLNSDDKLKTRVKEYFHLNPEQKIVLYAPTFRKTPDISLYDLNPGLCLDAFRKRFGGEFVFLIRLHPNEAHYSHFEYTEDVIDASAYPDMQELLACADALITDYSSSMFDMCFANRPVFLYAKDLLEYTSKDRKLFFEINALPFSFASDVETLCSNIAEFSQEDYNLRCEKFKESIGFEDSGCGAAVISGIILDYIEQGSLQLDKLKSPEEG